VISQDRPRQDDGNARAGRARRAQGSVLALVGLLMLARPATAEEAALREAGERFDQGVQLFDDGSFEAALAEFLRAYEIAPNYAVLYNIGQTYAELRRTPEAVRAFRQYLDEGGTSVPPRRRQEVERELARLERLVGRIALTVRPEVPATVYLDGTEASRLPAESPLLAAAGEHEVEVRAEGFLPFRRSVTVAGGVEASVEAELTRAGVGGGILVTLEVPGAVVTVDGREVGQTPLAEPIDVSEGGHVVAASRPGYQSAEARVAVASGEVARVVLDLQPLAELPPELAGTVALSVSERGAAPLLDGAPLEGRPIPIGPHSVSVEREGFEPWSRQIEVAAGEVTTLEAVLLPTAPYRARYEARANGMRIASYVMAGLAVAAIGTSVGLLAWNAAEYDSWLGEDEVLQAQYQLRALDPSSPETLPDDEVLRRQADNDTLIDRVHLVDGVGYALLGVGIAAAATWAGLFFGGPDPARYRSLSVSASPGGLALALRWP